MSHPHTPQETPFLILPLVFELHTSTPVILQGFTHVLPLFTLIHSIQDQSKRHIKQTYKTCNHVSRLSSQIDPFTDSIRFCLSSARSFSSCTWRSCSSSVTFWVAVLKFAWKSCQCQENTDNLVHWRPVEIRNTWTLLEYASTIFGGTSEEIPPSEHGLGFPWHCPHIHSVWSGSPQAGKQEGLCSFYPRPRIQQFRCHKIDLQNNGWSYKSERV